MILSTWTAIRAFFPASSRGLNHTSETRGSGGADESMFSPTVSLSEGRAHRSVKQSSQERTEPWRHPIACESFVSYIHAASSDARDRAHSHAIFSID